MRVCPEQLAEEVILELLLGPPKALFLHFLLTFT